MSPPTETSPPRSRLSLNGTWRCRLDRNDIGRKEGWFEPGALDACGRGDAPDPPDAGSIEVPGCLEETHPGFDGVIWYSRRFTLPSSWKADVIRIRFGAVNYFAEVWINGRLAGSHEGGYTPFGFEITPLVNRPGVNTAVVRVVDPGREAVDGLDLVHIPAGKETWLYNFGGIWQDVELLGFPAVYVQDCFVMPRTADRSADIKLAIFNLDCGVKRIDVQLAVVDGQGDPAAAARLRDVPVGCGLNHVSHTLRLPQARLWTPDDPQLYRLVVSLHDAGRAVDETSVRFGMRELSIRGDRFLLNGREIMVRGCLTQGYYPVTLAYPDPETARRELAACKEAGLNMLRLHLKTTSPVTLDLADEMGLLLYEEAPIGWMRESAFMESRCRTEVVEMIRRDRNHPSVVIWGVMNEHRDPTHVRSGLALLAHREDPSRVVIDDSGGWTGSTFAYTPYREEPVPIEDLHVYRGFPTDEDALRCFRELGCEDRLTFVSEYGYGGMQDLEQTARGFADRGCRTDLEDYRDCRKAVEAMERCFTEWGLHRAFGSPRELCAAVEAREAEALRLATEALRTNPRVAGYHFTALTAAGWEQHGMLDIWRNPKKVFDAVRDVNRSPYLALLSDRHNCLPGAAVELTPVLIDAEITSGDGDLRVELESSGGRPLIEGAAYRSAGSSMLRFEPVRLEAPRSPGPFRIRAAVHCGQQAIASNLISLPVLRDAAAGLGSLLHGVPLPGGQPIVVSEGSAHVHLVPLMPGERRPPDDEIRSRILTAVEAGATAVVLAGGVVPESPEAGLLRGLLQWESLELLRSEGNYQGYFVPMFHWIKEHPIFQDLPSRCIAGQEYRNICPRYALIGAEAAGAIAGCFSGFNPSMEMRRGAELALIPMGRGRMIVSMFRLIPWLGKDPAADLMLENLLRFALGTTAA